VLASPRLCKFVIFCFEQDSARRLLVANYDCVYVLGINCRSGARWHNYLNVLAHCSLSMNLKATNGLFKSKYIYLIVLFFRYLYTFTVSNTNIDFA